MKKQELMFGLVTEQEQSGLTIVAFCASRSIKLSTFHYWSRKAREMSTARTGFIPIGASTTMSAQTLRLSYPNGVHIDLSGLDIPMIAQLIRLV